MTLQVLVEVPTAIAALAAVIRVGIARQRLAKGERRPFAHLEPPARGTSLNLDRHDRYVSLRIEGFDPREEPLHNLDRVSRVGRSHAQTLPPPGSRTGRRLAMRHGESREQ